MEYGNNRSFYRKLVCYLLAGAGAGGRISRGVDPTTKDPDPCPSHGPIQLGVSLIEFKALPFLCLSLFFYATTRSRRYPSTPQYPGGPDLQLALAATAPISWPDCR